MSLKIAVLDDYQGIAEEYFGALGGEFEIRYFKDTLLPYNHPETPRSVQDELVQRLEPFQIIVTTRERTPFPAELVRRLPKLKLLLTNSARNLALDLDALQERGVVVATVLGLPPVGYTPVVDSTPEHILTLIMALSKNIAADDASVKTGGWQTGCSTSLSGKTLGLVGLGRLGVVTAKMLHAALGMQVIAWSPNLTQDKADEQARAAGLAATQPDGRPTFASVSREDLFSKSDVVSLHLVLSDRSRGLITAADLHKMKPESFFVNTSRGPLVVERDLLDTLQQGRIRGAALDVFAIEPLPAESEWRTTAWGKDGRSQVLLTPHTGFVDHATIHGWYKQQAEEVVRWKNGQELGKRLV
ncbi:D-isomer specific 2-hydroxyacid dehydrogenase [Cordyceps militaris]|uniref:D-isomer specific 2-hydroxyacid dehydrogenase n=1 Tax=Cordyceps militaris TaxID=73501 RepID=A0A2H4SJI6_CORMI|nr:D-isomer specific 2-hydroxyacid dehydrogenase [Cordyceps militaris]